MWSLDLHELAFFDWFKIWTWLLTRERHCLSEKAKFAFLPFCFCRLLCFWANKSLFWWRGWRMQVARSATTTKTPRSHRWVTSLNDLCECGSATRTAKLFSKNLKNWAFVEKDQEFHLLFCFHHCDRRLWKKLRLVLSIRHCWLLSSFVENLSFEPIAKNLAIVSCRGFLRWLTSIGVICEVFVIVEILQELLKKTRSC